MRQIRLHPGGLWHRPLEGNGHTACGEHLSGAYAARDSDLDLDLCPLCFSKHERDTARIRRLQRDHDSEHGALYFDDEDPTDPDWIPNDWDREE